MGGRGTAGNTKLFTNIDADRNRGFREARAKEIETDRVAKATAQTVFVAKPKTARVAKKIVETKSTVSIANTNGTREDATSLARSKDGMLHVNKGGKYSFYVTDARSGIAVATLGSKKSAMKFLNAATRPDGKMSPTLQRHIEFTNTKKADFQALPREKRERLSRAFQAVMKLKERIGYD